MFTDLVKDEGSQSPVPEFWRPGQVPGVASSLCQGHINDW